MKNKDIGHEDRNTARKLAQIFSIVLLPSFGIFSCSLAHPYSIVLFILELERIQIVTPLGTLLRRQPNAVGSPKKKPPLTASKLRSCTAECLDRCKTSLNLCKKLQTLKKSTQTLKNCTLFFSTCRKALPTLTQHLGL